MSEVGLVALVQVQQHNIALLFANYLSSINIAAKVIQEKEGYVVVCKAEYVEQAKEIFEQFIQQPNHPKYQQAAWNNSEVTDVIDGQPLLQSFKQQFLAHAGIVTLVVFTLCWLVFIASLLGWQRDIFQQIHFYYRFDMSEVLQQPYRLIGPAFFHFSWLHIAFNTMWWWQLGGSIEREIGKGALINLFLVSAILSNVGQFFVSGSNFGGLSGVVYALVGYVWWMGWLAPQKGLFLSKSIIGFLLFWLLLGFVDVLPVNMANTAHLVGLVCGCLLALLNTKWSRN